MLCFHKALVLSVIFTLCIASSGAAKPPLSDIEYVSEGLITAGTVIVLADECPDVSIRLIKGYFYLLSLKRHARDLGYSAQEIEAYIDDKQEKARLEQITLDRLAKKGVQAGQSDSYCAVARAEISQDSEIGKLLTK